jgi:hypothetical protein
MAKIDWLEPANRFRATPMDLLKQGIVRRQWAAVEACYLMLTGEKLTGEDEKTEVVTPAQAAIEEEPEDIAAEAGMALSGPIEEEEEIPEIEEDEEPSLDEDEDEGYDDEEDDDGQRQMQRTERIRTKTSKVGTKPRRNKFVDDGVEAAEDMKFMPKKEVMAQRVKHRRPSYNKVKVTCSKCGAREIVDPVLVPRKIDAKYKPRYVCNDCSTNGGNN